MGERFCRTGARRRNRVCPGWPAFLLTAFLLLAERHNVSALQVMRSAEVLAGAGAYDGDHLMFTVRGRGLHKSGIGVEGFLGRMYGYEPRTCVFSCPDVERSYTFLLIGPTLGIEGQFVGAYAGISGGADLNGLVGYWTWQLGVRARLSRSASAVLEQRWFDDTGGAQEGALTLAVAWKVK